VLKPIIVTITDEALGKIDKIAKKLAARGMEVSQVMAEVGVIAGACDLSKTSALERVSGVHSVEEEAVANLPPPDSPVQ